MVQQAFANMAVENDNALRRARRQARNGRARALYYEDIYCSLRDVVPREILLAVLDEHPSFYQEPNTDDDGGDGEEGESDEGGDEGDGEGDRRQKIRDVLARFAVLLQSYNKRSSSVRAR